MLKKSIYIPALVAVIMFGFTFAMVPVYNALCNVTGLNTAVPVSLAPPDYNRAILIQFVTANNRNLPWDFYPLQTSINVHPNENAKVFFYFKNNSTHTMTVQAIPSITPGPAVSHFHKIECFCFQKQTLNPGQTLTVPLVFRLDNDVSGDVSTVTLGYTLFDVTNQKKATA